MATVAEVNQELTTRPAGLANDSLLKRRVIEHIAATLKKDQQCRVSQITKSHFRVNVYTHFMSKDMAMPTWRITSSRFLHVEEREGELVVTDQTRNN